ncbi:SWEET3 [Symbiodinium necroappetens]|uniref:Sugar transporter SWEET1 n=1 Tax=Symbiodinium necroappetens TaxID=1628268 RepID=A0A813A2P8_9DINO|nr:SWEET3 [Symbiodinium necroappetens]
MFADLILESLATCLAFFFMTSPLTQAIDVIGTPAKVKHINPANLLGFFLNCMTQLGYGIFMPIPPMIRCNVYGVAVGLFSIATCWYFALGTANAERWNAQACVGTISVFALSGLIFAYAGLGGEGAAARVGSLGILVSIIMYAAPLSVLREVLQTKSSKALPGPQIFMGFLNSLCWFAVGIRRQKMPVWVPNVIGMLLSLAQLALILKFPDRPESVEEQRKDDALLLPVALVNGARSFQNAVSSGKASPLPLEKPSSRCTEPKAWTAGAASSVRNLSSDDESQRKEMVPALLSASDRLADARLHQACFVPSSELGAGRLPSESSKDSRGEAAGALGGVVVGIPGFGSRSGREGKQDRPGP